MPKISIEIKNQIAALSKNELEKIVIKMAAKDKVVFDYLLVNYLEKETGKNELLVYSVTFRTNIKSFQLLATKFAGTFWCVSS